MTNKDIMFYTIDEVAEMLRVDHQSVRRYIKSGKMKACKIGPKLIRIPASEVEYLTRDKQ